ncbi:DUF5719 family protein [Nocardioides litoris]|uniref:DUF5719 family protein n=1 Tax=Nocardioides litoris TaxID=1926648 RepID=UPI00111DE2A0|nr:DUF5719 family protein [Nocardioides litoris]
MSVPDPSRTTAGTRTARTPGGRRLDVTTLLAVLLPLLAVAVALVVRTDGGAERTGAAAEEVPLTRASVVCPGGGSDVLVTSTSGADGTVQVRAGDEDRDVEVGPGRVAEVDLGERPAVVTGEGDLAPGLVAGRFSSPLASFDCRAPVFDQWFTGVGAGARHQSVLQLVNPDEGRAVVDVEVLGAEGEVDAPGLRGIAVPGGQTRALPLAEVLPRRDELALHVTVVRGRVAASVRDTVRDLGRGRSGDDGLASQSAPAATNLLLGVPSGTGPRSLVLANTAESEGRASISFVTGRSTFAPAGLEAVELPPRSTVVVPLTQPLAQAATDGEAGRPVGLQVESTVPATAALSGFVRGDLATAVPVDPLAGSGTAVLPAGDKTLVLGGSGSPGVVTVTARDADGRQLAEERVEVAAGRAPSIELPGAARLVTVAAARTTVQAVVLVVGDGGATVVRVREPVTTGLVPDVRVGLP